MPTAVNAGPTVGRYREADVLGWLQHRYTAIRPGSNADRYVRAQHARYPSATYSGEAVRIADYLVLDTYKPQRLLGFEIKTNRPDWLAELKAPEKAEVWRQHCHQWYLVVPDAAIVCGDLPPGWGLLAPTTAGTLAVRRAARTNPAPLPLPFTALAQLGRAIAQTAAREARPR